MLQFKIHMRKFGWEAHHRSTPQRRKLTSHSAPRRSGGLGRPERGVPVHHPRGGRRRRCRLAPETRLQNRSRPPQVRPPRGRRHGGGALGGPAPLPGALRLRPSRPPRRQQGAVFQAGGARGVERRLRPPSPTANPLLRPVGVPVSAPGPAPRPKGRRPLPQVRRGLPGVRDRGEGGLPLPRGRGRGRAQDFVSHEAALLPAERCPAYDGGNGLFRKVCRLMNNSCRASSEDKST